MQFTLDLSQHISQSGGASKWQGNILFQPGLARKQTANIFSVISRAFLLKHGQDRVITVITTTFLSPQDACG